MPTCTVHLVSEVSAFSSSVYLIGVSAEVSEFSFFDGDYSSTELHMYNLKGGYLYIITAVYAHSTQ